MIFQAGAIVALLVLAAYSLTQRRRAPVVAALMLLSAMIGAVLVAAPDLATAAAEVVGVGRGADLVFYVFVLIALGAIFNLHLRLRSHEQLLTRLSRAIAIGSAKLPPDKDQALPDR